MYTKYNHCRKYVSFHVVVCYEYRLAFVSTIFLLVFDNVVLLVFVVVYFWG